ncbi:RcnB family protein [Sedimenticola hydrogenitrophicus]|uniref:RcnB family protein n=1 Tax=Sedimenticola hydrogenitrophicus TaxID=2967975 RepID=UPI0021A7EFA9|nr:RcnB family protein [Sedimenticola hydrogenitrophicus]
MSLQRCTALLAGLLLILIALPFTTQARDSDALLGAVFSEIERRTIEEYYRGRFGRPVYEQQRDKAAKKQKGLPPGLARRDRLPPGLEQQLERNGHLPPGLEKRELPEGLERLLPPRRPEYRRVVVDNDVLLIEVATGLILDILRDVF